jgi:hypothetical protein
LCGKEWDRRNEINWKQEHEDLANKGSVICVGGKWYRNWLFRFVYVVFIVEYECSQE